MTALSVVLIVLATARLTRLVVADRITYEIRRWVQARVPEHVAFLLGCPWCASPYVGALLAAVTVYQPENRVWLVVLIALAASEITGLVASWLDPPEDYGDVEIDDDDVQP